MYRHQQPERKVTVKTLKTHGALGALGLLLALILAACGGEEPTPTPRPAATPTPADTTMQDTAEPTPTPAEAMMEDEPTAEPETGGDAGPAPTPTPVPAATPTPVPPDPSFDAEGYFSGKTLRMMVGFNPGGGTDAQARYMSREWPQFIPGNPRIIVTNMTPVVTERNFVWNSKPDGLTLAIEASPGIFDQFTPQAQFDMRESTMIGITSGKEGLWVIRGTMPYDCFESAWNSPGPTLTIATSVPTPADLGSDVVIGWLADLFNVPVEIRNLAAAGSAEQYLYIERGDTNSWVSGTLWDQFPRTRPSWLPTKFVRPFADLSVPGFDLGHNGQIDFHCPNVADAHLDAEQTSIYNAMRGPQIYAAKNIIGPPGIPTDVTAALRKALADAMADEAFASGMQRFTGIKNTFTHGDQADIELDQTVEDFIANKDVIDEITLEVFNKYVR